jgi:hypothetical protein
MRDPVKPLAGLVSVDCHLVIVIGCCLRDEMVAVGVDELPPRVPVGDVRPAPLVRVLFIPVG